MGTISASKSLDSTSRVFSLLDHKGRLTLFSRAVKVVSSTAAAYLVMGPTIALISLTVELIFSSLSLINNYKLSSEWISSFSLSHAKKVFIWHSPLMVAQLIGGFVSSYFRLESDQYVAKLIKEAFSKGFFASSKMVFFACVRAPLLEEIFFRGFLQDKIRIIEVTLLKMDEDSKIAKVMRIFIQGIAFGFAHFHRMQTLSVNVGVIIFTSFFGMILGSFKEEQNNLGGCIILHALHNSCVIARLFFFGG